MKRIFDSKSSSDSPSTPFNLATHIESWSPADVSRWISGIGENLSTLHVDNGSHLMLLDDGFLAAAGIHSLGKRKLILQAIQLLQYFSYEMPDENLSTLCTKVAAACEMASREVLRAQSARQMAVRRAQVVSCMNALSNALSFLAEHTKRLIFWLDRSPFDGIDYYIHMRGKVCFLIWEIVQMVNAPPKTIFERTLSIVEKMNQLRDECEGVLRRSLDPLILATSYLEKAVLTRLDDTIPWGINLQSSYRGVHVVNEVKIGSPADLSGKIDAGDELVLINDDTVLGWELSSVAATLAAHSPSLSIIVRKRPRDSVPLTARAPRVPAGRPLKLAPGSIAPEEESSPFTSSHVHGRRRSSTFVQQLAGRIRKGRPQLLSRRRFSVSGASVPVSPVDTPQYDLLEDIPTHVVQRTRTMRQLPNGYTRSFIDNKLVTDSHEDDEQLAFNVPCPSEFSEVIVVSAAEVSKLGLPEARPTDPEWTAPINDRLRPYRATEGDSGMSLVSSLYDSPKTSGLDENVAQSPSAWSLRSTGSPMCIVGDSDEFNTQPKAFEGWIRRRKTSEELHAATNKWPKCWMSLQGSHLYLRETQHSRKTQFVFCVSECTVNPNPTIKTSKKFVFSVSRSSFHFFFSAYSMQEHKSWVRKISESSRLACARLECARREETIVGDLMVASPPETPAPHLAASLAAAIRAPRHTTE